MGPDEGTADSTNRDRWRPWRVHRTPFAHILAYPYKGSGADGDPLVVTWLPAGEDPENPLFFPEVYKWANTMMGERLARRG